MTNKTSISKLIKIILATGLVIVSYFIYRNLVTSPQVALIGNETGSSSCKTLVNSFNLQNECTEGYFQSATYTCAVGESQKLTSGDVCRSSMEMYELAQKNCGSICEVAVSTPVSTSIPRPTPLPCVPNPCREGMACTLMELPAGQSYCPKTSVPPKPSLTPTPTPKPSTPATPPPTSDPNALPITCKLITQKIPRGMSGWSPSQIIDPSGASILPGEKLGYAIELTNPNKYQVGGALKLATTNLSGSNEPVTVDSYGGLCVLNESTKTMTCESNYITIGATSSMVRPDNILPSMTIVMAIADTVTAPTYTGIKFTGSIGNSSFECSPTTQIKIEPNCTVEKPFCLSSLLGKACPTITTCEKPVPTSTPKPTTSPISYASPVSTIIPSPIAVATTIATSSPVSVALTAPATCGKSLSSWKYRESCDKKSTSYRYIDYLCAGDKVSTQIGNSKLCQTEKQLYASAKEACANRACSTPTPTITARPMPTVTPRCINIFRWRYCPTTNRSSR